MAALDRLNDLLEQRSRSDDPNSIVIDLPDADLRGANLANANLRDANLERAGLADADLRDADLTIANLRRGNLRRANLTRANLTRADLGGANLTYANLERAGLADADLRDADLTIANLRRANLRRANLTRAILTNAGLADADLRDADLSGANLTVAHLIRANFTGADLEDANLTRANLAGANFTGANLEDANLTRANLAGANLTYAILTGANLTGANLTGANLTGANLTQEQREAAVFDVPDVPHQGVAHVPHQGVAHVPQRGLAFEVHNGFSNFIRQKKEEYLSIINQPNVEFPGGDIYSFIEDAFVTNIRNLFPQEEANTKIAQLRTLLTKIRDSPISEDNKQLIAKSIQFVFSQSDENFKREYILSFLKDCTEAYSGPGDNTSCVYGIIERFVLSVGSAVQIVCIDDSCENETYKRLDKLMNPRFNINDAAKEWWDSVDDKQDELGPMTADQRKEHFINYLREKAREEDSYNEDIEEQIREYADGINYAFGTLVLGGKKTRKSHKKKSQKKKSYKKNKSQKKNKKSQKKNKKSQKKKKS